VIIGKLVPVVAVVSLLSLPLTANAAPACTDPNGRPLVICSDSGVDANGISWSYTRTTDYPSNQNFFYDQTGQYGGQSWTEHGDGMFIGTNMSHIDVRGMIGETPYSGSTDCTLFAGLPPSCTSH
jgi:hypothetical protein